MEFPDPQELDRIFSLWDDGLRRALGISASEAQSKPPIYRYRITSIDRLDANLIELKIEFSPNAVYGVRYLSGSTVSIVIPMYVQGEVNAPPGMPHLLTDFIVSGGIQPSNFIGENAEGAPRVYWDSSQ